MLTLGLEAIFNWLSGTTSAAPAPRPREHAIAEGSEELEAPLERGRGPSSIFGDIISR